MCPAIPAVLQSFLGPTCNAGLGLAACTPGRMASAASAFTGTCCSEASRHRIITLLHAWVVDALSCALSWPPAPLLRGRWASVLSRATPAAGGASQVRQAGSPEGCPGRGRWACRACRHIRLLPPLHASSTPFLPWLLPHPSSVCPTHHRKHSSPANKRTPAALGPAPPPHPPHPPIHTHTRCRRRLHQRGQLRRLDPGRL